MSRIIDQVFREVCLDERIPDGIFDMSNNLHMEVLRENLTDQGIALNDVKSIHNKMLEGKYPERQAYNKDGLLVTFPTPAHKQRALQRGTHFEQDPTHGRGPSAFGTNPSTVPSQPEKPAPEKPMAPTPEKPEPKPAPQQGEPPQNPAPAQPSPQSDQGSSLPASDSPAQAPAPSGGGGGQSSPSSLPASDSQDPEGQQQLAVEPPPAQQQAPNPPPNFNTTKSPQERAAEAQVVKQMMKGGEMNPSFTPTLNERRYIELNRIFDFAKQMGYTEGLKVISEALR